MPIKLPTVITEKWLSANCRCQRRHDQPTWLLCQESCPVHDSVTLKDPAVRKVIADMTREMGLRTDWCLEREKEMRT